jgi:cytidine deaminase
LVGDVAAALQTVDGDVFTGVPIDTSSWGRCAERSAAAAMLTAGQYRVTRIVAIWQEYRDGRGDDLVVLPPCGHCRQFLLDIDAANSKTEVVLGLDESMTLGELLPRAQWPTHLTIR